MWTYNKLWDVTSLEEVRAKIDSQKYSGEIHNLEEQALSLVGKDKYETLIKEYTEKQWGRECKNLPSFIIKRLPTDLLLMETILMIDIKVFLKAGIII